jgi:hypothetical protein
LFLEGEVRYEVELMAIVLLVVAFAALDVTAQWHDQVRVGEPRAGE